MKQQKKKQIEWFLELANMDFENDTPESQLDLLQRMINVFGKTLHPDFSDLRPTLWEPETWNAMTESEPGLLREMAENLLDAKRGSFVRIQGILREFINGMNQRFDNAKRYQQDGGEPLREIGLSDITNLRTLGQFDIEGDIRVMIRNKPKLERHPKKNRMWVAYWSRDRLENSPVEIMITPRGSDEGFLFSFVKTLDGVPLTFVRSCSECGNWFLQSGKRERGSCSTRCKARKANRERRRRVKEEGEKNISQGSKAVRNGQEHPTKER